MKRNLAIGILLAALTIAGSAQISAQENGPRNQARVFVPDGETVYDVVNHVTWLANGNLATTSEFRFGLALCDPLAAQPPGRIVRERQRHYELYVRGGMGPGHWFFSGCVFAGS